MVQITLVFRDNMAYVEIWKSGKLLIRRMVNEEKACKGCKVRLGQAGEVQVAINQSEMLGPYEVHMFAGDPPKAHANINEKASAERSEVKARPTLDFSVGVPASNVSSRGTPPDIEGYKIIEPLGEGGMGMVWRAEQLSTKRQVAIKVMAAPRFASQKAQARFEREVELTARLDHPNIARIYDSGLHHGIYYYAMELVDGMPLDRYVKDKGLSKNQILALMQKVCQAVLYAHLRAVIHRDLKPSNIIVTEDGQPHVLDFGLAKALLDEGETLSLSIEGQIAGTPAYMSPEQAAGRHEQTDTRTDVFSLGVILYELLTGQSPHDRSGSMIDLLHQITEGKVRRPREIEKSIDSELEAILLKALALNPEDRYASAGALAKDITSYLDEEPLDARVPTTLYFLHKKARKYRLHVAAILTILVLVSGAVIVAYTRIVEEKTLRQALARELELSKLSWNELEDMVSGSNQKDALAAFRILQDMYTSAKEDVSRLNSQLAEKKPPVAVRRIDLGSGKPMSSNVLVAEPSLPGEIESWTLDTRGHRGRITKLVYNPDGNRLASACEDGTIRVWDSQSGQLLKILVDPNSPSLDLGWSEDGAKLLAGSADSNIPRFVWDIKTDRIEQADQAPVTVSWHDASKTSWSADGELDILANMEANLPTGWLMLRRQITALALSDQHNMLAVGDCDGTIRFFDKQSEQVRHTCTAAWCGPVHEAQFSPDGKVLATCAGLGTVCLWDAYRWEPLRKFDTDGITGGSASSVNSIAWAPDGTAIARANNRQGFVEILDSQSGELLRKLHTSFDEVSLVSWSSNGMVAVATEGGPVQLWNISLDSNEPISSLPAHSGSVKSLAWMQQDHRLITAGDDGKIDVWESPSGERARSFQGSTSPVTCLALSPDGRILAAGSDDGLIRLWDTASGWTSRLLRGDPNDIRDGQSSFTAVCWSPDGTLLASGDSNGNIRIWNPMSRNLSYSFTAECKSISSLAWSPDGRVLLCGGADGTVRVWDVMRDYQKHVVLQPLWGSVGPGIAIGAAGDYRGPPGIADHLVYAARTMEAQMTLSPADFQSKYGWVNEPWQVGLYKPGAENIQRIYVNAVSQGPYDGKTWETAFSDLQDALSIAEPDTEIWVAAGTYTPDRGTGARTASFHLKNSVRLLGGFSGTETSSYQRDPNNNETILTGDIKGDDGPDFLNNYENSYHVVIAYGTDGSAVLDGFVITSGNANRLIGLIRENDWSGVCGGGVYVDGNAGPTLDNCTFKYNSATRRGGGLSTGNSHDMRLVNCKFFYNRAEEKGHGGGVYNRQGKLTMIDCTFARNSARDAGGAYISSHDGTIISCTFAYNSSVMGQGGGIVLGGGKNVLRNCVFMHNSAKETGGGIMCDNNSEVALINCYLTNNSSGSGGGISNHLSSPRLTNCVFVNNEASYKGGAISNSTWEEHYVEPKITNCTFIANRSSRDAGDICSAVTQGRLKLNNCILWHNTDSDNSIETAQIQGERIDINNSCIQNWSGELGGTGNFGVNPMFVDPNGPDGKIGTADDDLRLSPGSPCINKGDNFAIPADAFDLDGDGDPNEPIPFDIGGNPRILNGTVDIGAYESG